MKPAKRILVVDDEKIILLSLAYALKADGVEVITCNRAEWAQKALQNYQSRLCHFQMQPHVLHVLSLRTTGPIFESE